MTWLYTLRLRWLSLFRRNHLDHEIDDELRDHLDQQIATNLAAGMSPEQARTQALRAIGGITQVKEHCVEAHRFNATENLAQNLRFGLRQLLRNPGFSALAIFCLILGIGANASVFSWLEGILFRPYPAVAHQERLVALAGTSRSESRPTEISWPDFQTLRQSCTQCDALFVSKITSSTLNIGARAEVTIGSIVSANYFDAIGVRPTLGRAFDLTDDTGSNAHPVVVISDQLWHRRFNADPNIIGKVQRLNNVPHTIIGVAPPGFYGTFVGFSTTNVVETSVSLVAAGYDAPRARDFQDNLIDRVRDLPGVDSAAFARLSPLGYGSYSSTPIAVDGYDVPIEDQPTVEYNQVSPGYFATLGIPLVSGREFTRNDNEKAPLVAIVNRTMAQRFWRGQDPIGRRVKIKNGWARVVAVAADSKVESMREDPTPFFYVPLRQDFVRAPILYLRTTQPLPAAAAALLQQVHALDANLALYELTTLQQQVNRSTSPQLVAVTLVALLSSLAVILAAVGLYGVISYSVAQSTRELGLRMALGANASRLLRMVIARGLRLTAAGILLGVAAGFALTRLLGNILFNVSPHDPTAFASALIMMTLITLAACLLPAWRATRVDPTQVLRS
ncbi:MAG: ABC transporter permease [Acidobacteriaceae bacterium]